MLWKPELIEGARPGSVHTCRPSGWMQTSIFVEWFDHFILCAKPTCDQPILLVLSGHSTHTKNIARENHVYTLCLPPYCTHCPQPLDVTTMKPISLYYDDAVRMWLRNPSGRVVDDLLDVCSILHILREGGIGSHSCKWLRNHRNCAIQSWVFSAGRFLTYKVGGQCPPALSFAPPVKPTCPPQCVPPFSLTSPLY